jgi:hypothetical protein
MSFYTVTHLRLGFGLLEKDGKKRGRNHGLRGGGAQWLLLLLLLSLIERIGFESGVVPYR